MLETFATGKLSNGGAPIAESVVCSQRIISGLLQLDKECGLVLSDDYENVD